MKQLSTLAGVVASVFAFTSLSTTAVVAQEAQTASAVVSPAKKTLADVEYRLPSTIAPTFQYIHLNINPDNPTYSGKTNIDVTVKTPTKKVGFYQQDLTVTSARLVSGSSSFPLNVTIGEYDINWGESQDEIAPGKYTLEITFEGKVNKSSDGMYLSRFEETNYIFTQFEDMHARKAFPSFDEPNFKIPYQMTISSPEHQEIVGNTPVEKVTVENGIKTVVFEKTKPMPIKPNLLSNISQKS